MELSVNKLLQKLSISLLGLMLFSSISAQENLSLIDSTRRLNYQFGFFSYFPKNEDNSIGHKYLSMKEFMFGLEWQAYRWKNNAISIYCNYQWGKERDVFHLDQRDFGNTFDDDGYFEILGNRYDFVFGVFYNKDLSKNKVKIIGSIGLDALFYNDFGGYTLGTVSPPGEPEYPIYYVTNGPGFKNVNIGIRARLNYLIPIGKDYLGLGINGHIGFKNIVKAEGQSFNLQFNPNSKWTSYITNNYLGLTLSYIPVKKKYKQKNE